MTELKYTTDNVELIQEFLDETKRRIAKGVDLTFTNGVKDQIEDLAMDYDLDTADIIKAILDLTAENYYQGLDASPKNDYQVCAFCTTVGFEKVEIYLKYGLQKQGLEILLFSCHIPDFPITQPFKIK